MAPAIMNPPIMIESVRGSEKMKNPSNAAKTMREEDIIDPVLALIDL